jgi:hypothetical protein
VCDPNLERVDLFASLVQTVEVPSAFASARSLPPSRPMSASTCPNRCRGTAGAAIGIDHAGSRFPDVGHAFAPA